MIEFPVTEKKQKELYNRMAALSVEENDLQESFVKGSGKGGQKVNKTSSAVVLKYDKENLEIKCSIERSRGLNRYYARVILCEKLELLYKKGKKFEEIEKLKKRKKKNKKKAKEREFITNSLT